MSPLKAASFILLAGSLVALSTAANGLSPTINKLVRRSTSGDQHNNHKAMVHNHLSRKVFDRACAASKDTVDEIVECLTGNETIMKHFKPEVAGSCYKDAFGAEFDPKERMKHKDMICKNREKFEEMTACIYRKTAEALDSEQMEKVTEALVDVGLCIINALDG